MESHSVESDAEFAFGLQQQEFALLNDSHVARTVQSQEEDDDAVMISDNDEDGNRGNRHATPDDEELARQLQREFDEESRIEHPRRYRRPRGARVHGTRLMPYRHVARSRSDADDPHNPVSFHLNVPDLHTLHRNVVVNGVPVNGMMSGFINGVQFAFDNDSDIDDYEALWDLAEQNGDVVRRGLNTDEINVLPTSKFSEKPASTSSQSDQSTVSEDSECRVCLSRFEPNETLRTLPCLHRFHRNCIDKWIKRNAVCPVCRVKLRDQIGS